MGLFGIAVHNESLEDLCAGQLIENAGDSALLALEHLDIKRINLQNKFVPVSTNQITRIAS